MKITNEIIDRLIRAAEGLLNHDGYAEPEIKAYMRKHLRKDFADILNHHYASQPSVRADAVCHFCGKKLDDNYLRCDNCRYAG